MPVYYVKNTNTGGAIVEAASQAKAIAAVNFGGRRGKLVARRARPGDRSWSAGCVNACDYVERHGIVYLTENKIRRLFSIPANIAVYPEAPPRRKRGPRDCQISLATASRSNRRHDR